MGTFSLPISGRLQTALRIPAGTVSAAGVAIALAALGLEVWETLGQFGEIPLYFIIREWLTSPTMLLLVVTIFWIERLVTLHRSGHSRLARMSYSRPTIRLIGRAHQWFGLLAAWVSSSIALLRLTESGVTATLIVSVLTFGLSMWLLEGLSLQQAFVERDARRERRTAAGPIGC